MQTGGGKSHCVCWRTFPFRPLNKAGLSRPNLTGERNAGDQTHSRSTKYGAVTRCSCATQRACDTQVLLLWMLSSPSASTARLWEERASVLGVCCVLPMNSWHMILQGLVPSATNENPSCYTVPLSETGIWKNITKLWLVCWYKFDFWTIKLLLKITFSGLSST